MGVDRVKARIPCYPCSVTGLMLNTRHRLLVCSSIPCTFVSQIRSTTLRVVRLSKAFTSWGVTLFPFCSDSSQQPCRNDESNILLDMSRRICWPTCRAKRDVQSISFAGELAISFMPSYIQRIVAGSPIFNRYPATVQETINLQSFVMKSCIN